MSLENDASNRRSIFFYLGFDDDAVSYFKHKKSIIEKDNDSRRLYGKIRV